MVALYEHLLLASLLDLVQPALLEEQKKLRAVFVTQWRAEVHREVDEEDNQGKVSQLGQRQEEVVEELVSAVVLVVFRLVDSVITFSPHRVIRVGKRLDRRIEDVKEVSDQIADE